MALTSIRKRVVSIIIRISTLSRSGSSAAGNGIRVWIVIGPLPITKPSHGIQPRETRKLFFADTAGINSQLRNMPLVIQPVHHVAQLSIQAAAFIFIYISARPKKIFLTNRCQTLVCFGQVDASIIMFDDLFIFDAHFGKAVGSVLTHADAVAPAAAGKRIACSGRAVVTFVHDKKLFV